MERPKLETMDKKKLALLLVLVLVILLGCSFQYGRVLGQRQQAADLLLNPAEPNGEEPSETVPTTPPDDPAPEVEPEPLLLAVHVKGAVANPGLYELAEGQRVADALALAGLLEEANTDVINLALPLSDGLEVVVPFRVEGEETDWQALLEQSAVASGAVGGADEGWSSGGSSAPAYTGVVNINTDGLARLQSLEGIGAVKAQAIIDYREANGPFARIEDITKVSGIGSATFEKIKDRISVD